MLLGRRDECASLDRLVADVVGGTSRVLVLRGDAGVGKSALLEYLIDRVAKGQLVSVVGVESEMGLAYSGLHQLCLPLLRHLDRLPGPQRSAIETVFGLDSGTAPSRLIVGLAALTLLAEAAESGPLFCVVDDAHWLDDASAEVLAFVARRLLAESVALLCAARTGIGDHILAELPALPIPGLGDDDARTLLLGNLHSSLDPGLTEQIIAESGGNPLALLELPRTWSATDLAGGYGLPNGGPVTGRIEESYLRRLSALPADTHLLLLAAAAEPLGDPGLLYRAAEILGLDMEALAPAVDAELIRLPGRVEFAHPLVRSAIYRAAEASERRQAHRALAEATEAEAYPDRRAWHRGRATLGPDEEVAAELERSAGRAQARGGLAAAAGFLTRAAELTPNSTVRTRRALDAAIATVQAGGFSTTRSLLSIARAGQVDELQWARIDLVRAQLAFATNRGHEATPLLFAAARRLETLDVELARETYLDTVIAGLFAARMPGEELDMREVARAVRAAPRRLTAEPQPRDALLDALAAVLIDDDETAVRLSRVALSSLATGAIPAGRTRLLWLGAAMASDLWDDESWSALSERYLQTARTTGALTELPDAVNSRAAILIFSGELEAAADLVDEGQSVADALGVQASPYASLALNAWRGRADAARQLISRTIRDAGSRGEGWAIAFSEYAHALLCNGLGRYDEALEAAGRVMEYSANRAGANLGLPELIEAASRTGRTDIAADALHRLAEKAHVSGSHWALGIEARSRALLSDDDTAEHFFQQANRHLSQTRVRAELARAHLLYGEWLRRMNRRVAARSQLSLAYGMFGDMGTAGFAERARRELIATGASVRKRSVDTRDELTAQEGQIARLARDGFSNSEIGTELFISARTVEWHLSKVFSKLEIRSRRQLRAALPAARGR